MSFSLQLCFSVARIPFRAYTSLLRASSFSLPALEVMILKVWLLNFVKNLVKEKEEDTDIEKFLELEDSSRG
ncbi:MAG: hypothetical protein R3A80_10890 [Bdellovibrionota bacterium]